MQHCTSCMWNAEASAYTRASGVCVQTSRAGAVAPKYAVSHLHKAQDLSLSGREKTGKLPQKTRRQFWHKLSKTKLPELWENLANSDCKLLRGAASCAVLHCSVLSVEVCKARACNYCAILLDSTRKNLMGLALPSRTVRIWCVAASKSRILSICLFVFV